MDDIKLKKFSFPFTPYLSQEKFMQALFHALEEEKLGIFESPTGTGKSLSLICGSLSWLKYYDDSQKTRLKSILEEKIEEEDEIDWFSSSVKKIEKENEKRIAKKDLEKIEKHEERISELKAKYHQKSKEIKTSYEEKGTNKNENSLEFNDTETLNDDFLLGDYNSDEETKEESDSDSDDSDDENERLKIFYCSRTHSQLAQFVREVQRTIFSETAQVTSLGSRKSFCINENVNYLSSLSMVNERCLDLQTKKKSVCSAVESGKTLKKQKTSTGCPFIKQKNIQSLSDLIISEVKDIEQIVTAGKKLKACPYYATRKSIKDSQLIVLPYNGLLHRSTREALGIKLKGSVVIIDEAHNLLETIGNIHSVIIGYNQLCESKSQLSEYLNRFQKKLNPKNLLYIKQIIFVINSYIKLLSSGVSSLSKDHFKKADDNSCVLTLHGFLHQTFTDNLNIFKLIQYMEKSKIAHKLHSYKTHHFGEVKLKEKKDDENTSSFLAKMQKGSSKKDSALSLPSNNSSLLEKSDPDQKDGGSPLLGFIQFLKALKGGDGSGEGRILVNFCSGSEMPSIKYLLLNPSSQFHDVVKECRSVILAGGTMAPVDEFKQQLFLSAGASPDRIVEFSCDHVVPEQNVLALVVTTGPSSVPFDFTFKKRKDPQMLNELGRTLSNICNIIPGGIVIFFPSYEYEEFVSSYFKKEKILDMLSIKKSVFREPKKSSQLDSVLSEYSKAAKSIQNGKKGAVLFSVVGGKMSEGINFSDELGRCVIMVGLPYPNSNSPELKEKMDYLNKHYPINSQGKTAGASYYENLCFKAINQSIGRSIRHRDDYGSILLLDHRYAFESSKGNLSSWISSKLQVCNSFGQTVACIGKI
ncbi:putative ATP-dependent DNA helicase DDX11 [Armadillidium vulgare]|nr:putative ATP-dependent DNA helicase DDX11 [Armadillidium vulgare]